jgi:hypothetical protein
MSKYEPQVNDYVIWKGKSELDKGWVYFKCDDYITIEVGTKPKPHCSVVRDVIHCKYHCLLLCYHWDWNQLEYVKTRKSVYDET